MLALLVVSILGVLAISAMGVVFLGAPRLGESEIRDVASGIVAVGLRARVTEKNVYRELPALYARYMALKEGGKVENAKNPWEYVSISDNFAADGSWDYFTGHEVTRAGTLSDGLVAAIVPAGRYAVFKLRCKIGPLFPLRIAQLKGLVYGRWLPASGLEFSGVEFEYNNAAMREISPYDIDLYVGVRDR